MDDSIDRRTFLRIQLLSSLGFCLSSCPREFGSADGDSESAAPTPAASADPVPPPAVSTADLLLFRHGAERYEELRGRFNLRVQKYPAVIVLCRDANDISAAVRYARQEGLAISVKSGGHSFEGFSSNDGGLVVDLSLLNRVEWLDGKTVRVGPACRLSELYDALLPRSRILPAGSCGSVGVGGLTLGCASPKPCPLLESATETPRGVSAAASLSPHGERLLAPSLSIQWPGWSIGEGQETGTTPVEYGSPCPRSISAKPT